MCESDTAPYGVRAGAKRLGKRDAAQQRDEPFVMPDGTLSHTLPDYVPPTKPYPLSHLTADLLEYASALLKPEGRLVFWLPTMNEENHETPIPTHPHFTLVAHSLQDFGKWGRRLITLEKKRDAPNAPMPRPSSAPAPVRANEDPHEFRNLVGRVAPHVSITRPKSNHVTVPRVASSLHGRAAGRRRVVGRAVVLCAGARAASR